MSILERSGHFTPAVCLLMAAVARVPLAMIQRTVVLSKNRNWLHFPWYSKKRGGAFVLGERIYVSDRFLEPTGRSDSHFLLLCAHEVGHLPHAESWGTSPWGQAKFVAWAASHYAVSALRHGRNAHREARIEQEAERGRWVLRELLERTRPELDDLLRSEEAMSNWIALQSSTLSELHSAYPGSLGTTV